MNNFEATIFSVDPVHNYGMKLLRAQNNNNSLGFGWATVVFPKVYSYLFYLTIEAYE